MADNFFWITVVLCLIPLGYMAKELYRDILLFRRQRAQSSQKVAEHALRTSEYDKILKVVNAIEMDFQPNSGVHHPEKVYLDRAHLIRTSTRWYQMINAL